MWLNGCTSLDWTRKDSIHKLWERVERLSRVSNSLGAQHLPGGEANCVKSCTKRIDAIELSSFFYNILDTAYYLDSTYGLNPKKFGGTQYILAYVGYLWLFVIISSADFL